MFDFIIFAATFLTVLLVAVIWFYPGSKAITTVPGLSPSKNEDGNMGDMARAGSLHEFLSDLHSRFGPISGFWWGKTYVVSIASPELLTQHNNVFDRPPLIFKSFEALIGRKSIQYANGVEGRNRRKTHDPVFAHDKIDRYLDYFETCAQQLETKLMSKGKDDQIPLFEECFVYTIHCAITSILGDYYKDEKMFKQFEENYALVWKALEEELLNLSPSQDKTHVKQFEKALDFLKSSILEAISHRKKNELHLQNNLILDALISNCSDEETLHADVITYLVGSFHTTGNLITMAMYFLATHKDVQDKLHKEVISVLGEKGSVDKYNISKFVYLNQVIDETLRCAVIAPFAARFQDFDSELGGHKIPKNTPVIHALGVSLQDEKLWPLPNKFDPDRFSPENRKKLPRNSFVPFGFAGKRKCPGYRFAYWDAGVFLATILRRFEVSMCTDQVVTPVYGLVTRPQEEIWVKVAKRNQSF